MNGIQKNLKVLMAETSIIEQEIVLYVEQTSIHCKVANIEARDDTHSLVTISQQLIKMVGSSKVLMEKTSPVRRGFFVKRIMFSFTKHLLGTGCIMLYHGLS